MALTIAANQYEVRDALDLQEFVGWCDAAPSLHDPQFAQEIAAALGALCANRRLLPDFLIRELTNLRDFQRENTFKPPTFFLHRGIEYTIRAVVWLPLEALVEPSVFSYYEPHDHNFDFYTGGYFGPGYTTDIYEYDPDSVIGLPGESVELRFLERTTLSKGKVMFYRASRDVHVQLSPPSLSVSINLLLSPPAKPRRQFAFDLHTGRISGQVNAASWHGELFKAAALAGDERTLEVLVSIAETHPSETVRALAWQTLIERRPAQADQFFSTAIGDCGAYVGRAIEAYRRSQKGAEFASPIVRRPQ